MNRIKFVSFQKLLLVACLIVPVAIGSGCGNMSGLFQDASTAIGFTDEGTIISRRAQIRSSYAVVASDQLEVKRGEMVDILDEYDFEKVHWYRVRAHDDDRTEGWIEAQHVITGSLLEKSRAIAAQSKNVSAQATGRLLAASNLRLTPEQGSDNVILKLEKNSTFEILEWNLVLKPVAEETPKPDNSRRTPNSRDEIAAAKEDNEPLTMDEKYDFWYKVRLPPAVSPAPAGWLFGGQVQFEVPTDLAYFQRDSRKFVSWQRLDNAAGGKLDAADLTTQNSKPGSWVLLARTNVVRSTDGNEPDFDMILVLGYDKYREEYYTAYRIEDVWGKMPLRIDGPSDNRAFTVALRNAAGQMEDKHFVTYRDPKGHLRLDPPPDVYSEKKSDSK